jgi:23S rRNA G2445 N2-methylase RlmL
METQYFARVTAGLEQVAWEDIEWRMGATLTGFGHRRIDFRYDGPPAALLGLRSVDDVYVYAARLAGLDHTRASLARLTRELAQVEFAPALEAIRAARLLGGQPSYRVTASHLGRRNYSRYDVEGAAAEALAGRVPWEYVPNAPDEDEPDLDLRVLLEDDWALVGLRLGAAPLHRRAYKLASRPGSLKAPVAYCLALLAGVAPGASVLDLACGAGTILAEAAALAPRGLVIGLDADPASLALAHANLTAAGLNAPIVPADMLASALSSALSPQRESGSEGTGLLAHSVADVARLPERSADAVVTNLPWGRQAGVAGDLARVYAGFLGTVARALKPSGRAVLLTDQSDALLAALAEHPPLHLASSLQISLFGRHPTIFIFELSATQRVPGHQPFIVERD